jgi:hypothetical protein
MRFHATYQTKAGRDREDPRLLTKLPNSNTNENPAGLRMSGTYIADLQVGRPKARVPDWQNRHGLRATAF